MSQLAPTLRSDYFAEGDYVVTDPGKGVMRSRAGTRMVALTEDFLRGLREALDSECGPGADLVLRTCGRAWGADFARRVEKELSDFHGKPLQSEPLGLFEASLTSLFSHHGWGAARFDFTQHGRGLVVVAVRDPVIAAASAAESKSPGDPLLAGVLAGTFAHFTGQPLDCLQTECRSRGAAESRFVVALAERLKPLMSWPGQGKSHDEVVAELTRPPA